MTRRRKPSKAIETAVLRQSRRRCCVCFALHDEAVRKAGQIAHIDHHPSNNAPANLVWLCLEHHDEYDSRTSQSKGITPHELKEYRDRLYRAIEDNALANDDEPLPPIVRFPLTFQTTTGDNSPVINAAGDVNYNVRGGRKSPSVNPPPDAIGSSIEMRSYVEYLKGRYIEWRKKAIEGGLDQRRFFPGTMDNLIKRKFGARANLLPQARFFEVVDFLQKAIDNTIWGRKSRNRNYHSFDEHRARVRGKPKGPSDPLQQ